MTRIRFVRPLTLAVLLQGLGKSLDFVTGLEDLETIVESVSTIDGIDGGRNPRDICMRADPLASAVDFDRLCKLSAQGGRSILLLKDPKRYSLSQRSGQPAATTVLAVGDDIPWQDVLACLEGLSRQEIARSEDESSVALNDLAHAADLLAEALGGSIIIEDDNFQLMAYSRANNEPDQARRLAILQRRLPDRYQRAFNAQGILAALASGEDVIEARPIPEIGLGPRLVAAIRHQGELLGSVWLARDERGFNGRDRSYLSGAAASLGSQLHRILQARDLQQHVLNAYLLDLLHGHRPAEAASKLQTMTGLPEQSALHVLDFALWADVSAPAGSSLLPIIRTVVHSVAGSTRAVVLSAIEGNRLRVLLLGCSAPSDSCDEAQPIRFGQQILGDRRLRDIPISVGVGSHQSSLLMASRSADEAERVSHVLVARADSAVASLQQVWADVAIDSFLPLIDDPMSHWCAPLDRLRSSDRDRGTAFARTLEVALDHWGNIRGAADQLFIHPNTLRHRLSKIEECAGLRLEDPTQRLVLQLQLRHARRLGDLPTER
jgi:hypothetical protein